MQTVDLDRVWLGQRRRSNVSVADRSYVERCLSGDSRRAILIPINGRRRISRNIVFLFHGAMKIRLLET